MSLSLLDNGNRADESPVSNGEKWKGPVVAGNTAIALEGERFTGKNGTWCDRYWATKFAANQGVQGTVAATVTSRTFVFMVRVKNPGNNALLECYELGINTTSKEWALVSYIKGAEKTLGTATKAYEVGDKIRLEVEGTTLRAIHETGAGVKTTVLEKTDSGVTGEGFVGFAILGAGTGLSLDDITGGALEGVGPTTVQAPAAGATAFGLAPVVQVGMVSAVAGSSATAGLPRPCVSVGTPPSTSSASSAPPGLAIASSVLAGLGTATAAAPIAGAAITAGPSGAAASFTSPSLTAGLSPSISAALAAASSPSLAARLPVPATPATASAVAPQLVVGESLVVTVLATAATAAAAGLAPTPSLAAFSSPATITAGWSGHALAIRVPGTPAVAAAAATGPAVIVGGGGLLTLTGEIYGGLSTSTAGRTGGARSGAQGQARAGRPTRAAHGNRQPAARTGDLS